MHVKDKYYCTALQKYKIIHKYFIFVFVYIINRSTIVHVNGTQVLLVNCISYEEDITHAGHITRPFNYFIIQYILHNFGDINFLESPRNWIYVI